MKKFFPDDDVFYLDPNIDSDDENFIKGDGCAMPLKDETFDWVVSTDVYEHISSKKREKFLEENLRVAKKGVVLVAPFYSKEVESAEINSNENYKTLHNGTDHLWLKEHIDNILPQMDEFENFLTNRKLPFQKLYNNNILLWELLMGIEFLFYENAYDDIKKEMEDFSYFYNTQVYTVDNQEPSYRKIYFIKKDNNLKDVEIDQRPLDNSLMLETIKKILDLAINIDVDNKKVMIEGQQQIAALEQLT